MIEKLKQQEEYMHEPRLFKAHCGKDGLDADIYVVANSMEAAIKRLREKVNGIKFDRVWRIAEIANSFDCGSLLAFADDVVHKD